MKYLSIAVIVGAALIAAAVLFKANPKSPSYAIAATATGVARLDVNNGRLTLFENGGSVELVGPDI